MVRLIKNLLNTIVNFLIEIENYNIIVLSKFNPNDELAKDDSI